MTILDDLYAERYGRSLWWKTPATETTAAAQTRCDLLREDDLTIARRRRELDEAFGAEGGAA